jgi:hypothetical protein
MPPFSWLEIILWLVFAVVLVGVLSVFYRALWVLARFLDRR